MAPILGERSRHRDHEDIRRGDPRGGAQQPALDHAVHQPVEIDFLDMDFAAIDRFDDPFGHVEAKDVHPRAGDHRRSGQADIAKADDTHFRQFATAHNDSR